MITGKKKNSQSGTRTRAVWVRAINPNHLDQLGLNLSFHFSTFDKEEKKKKIKKKN